MNSEHIGDEAGSCGGNTAGIPRETIARALYEHRGHASDGAWNSTWATHRENGPSMRDLFLQEADRLLALHDATTRSMTPEIARLQQQEMDNDQG